MHVRTKAALGEFGIDLPDLPVSTADCARLDVLTPAERDVVRLVVGGMANGEVAGELGVTRRTVEQRLTKVYRKLGIGGRDELAVRVDPTAGGA